MLTMLHAAKEAAGDLCVVVDQSHKSVLGQIAFLMLLGTINTGTYSD